jgi:hypothetical protein
MRSAAFSEAGNRASMPLVPFPIAADRSHFTLVPFPGTKNRIEMTLMRYAASEKGIKMTSTPFSAPETHPDAVSMPHSGIEFQRRARDRTYYLADRKFLSDDAARIALLPFQLREDLLHGSFSGQAVFLPKDIHGAVFDELIRPADANDRSLDAGVVEVFDHGAAKAVV